MQEEVVNRRIQSTNIHMTSRLEELASSMNLLLNDIRANPVLWLLVVVPLVILAEHVWPNAQTALFIASIVAIVPLAVLLSKATESVAERTGDVAGGLLNATLGNLTEFVIAFTALKAGDYMLVKASIAGAIVTNTLFMLGGAFLIGGLRTHIQEFNRANARLQASLLFLATIALLVPSLLGDRDMNESLMNRLSVGLAVILLLAYGLGMLFSLRTHKELFTSAAHQPREAVWPLGVSVVMLILVTLLVALVSEIFVGGVRAASESLSLGEAFVGFIVVSLVGASAEMATAFSAAQKNRIDLSISIALGSAAQIALFVAPALVLISYSIGPKPMNLSFWPGAVAMMMIATLTATMLTNGGQSAWFLGVMILLIYAIFGLMLFLLPPVI